MDKLKRELINSICGRSIDVNGDIVVYVSDVKQVINSVINNYQQTKEDV